MAILPVRKYPDPVVREATRPVEKVDKEIKALVKNMIETMHASQGVGLAANQIGIQKSIIVAEIDERASAYINPKIIWNSDETEVAGEGCLSLIPDVHIPIERPRKVVVQALNAKGKPMEFEAEGPVARIFQHEIDHLSGKVILDRATDEVRKQALRSMSALFSAPRIASATFDSPADATRDSV